MNRIICVICELLFCGAVVVAAPASQPALPQVSPETMRLYEAWQATQRVRGTPYELANGPELSALAAAPDADLCFLHAADVHRYSGSWWSIAAVDRLGRLNTQRTFNVVAGRADAADWSDREYSIRLICAYKRPEAAELLSRLLLHDPVPQVRSRAAEVMHAAEGPVADAALRKAFDDPEPLVAFRAALPAARMNDPALLLRTIGMLENAKEHHLREAAVHAVGAYRRKAAVQAMLKELPKHPPEEAEFLAGLVRHYLVIFADGTSKVLGPLPETIEQWNDWWSRAGPLLNDDLTLKDPPKPAKTYVDADFGNAPGQIELRASVDAPEYRVGDPIRLRLEFENRSAKPHSLVLPQLPSGWWATMAFGVRLDRGKTNLINLEPSPFYVGSYSGPPPFEVLAPGANFKSNDIGLQYFLSGSMALPLEEGDYVLVISFDSSKFAGIQPKGVQLVSRWDAQPIRFSVRGAARKDSAEVLRVIGEKSGLRWIETDLISARSDRQNAAWRAVAMYGDVRLAPLVEKLHRDHPEEAGSFIKPADLPPFEWRRKGE